MRRVSPAGELRPIIEVAQLPNALGTYIRSAVYGSTILLAWCTRVDCSSARVSGDSASGVRRFSTYPSGGFDVSASGGDWLIVYGTSAGDVEGVRIASDGTILDQTPLAIAKTAAAEYAPAVASTFTGWLVAWS